MPPPGPARPSLAEQWRGPTEVREFLWRALAIVDALAAWHVGGALHGELRPQTIRYDAATGAVNFDPPTGAGPGVEGEALAAAAYAAPEQLRPTGRGVDRRADLYSLGVVLYELLLGRLPFRADDLLGWVHCHVAHAPRPPAESDSRVPAPLSAILVKLLAKAPEERYQGARGLCADLKRCISALERGGRVEPFRLAERDVPEFFRLPQRLYGREAQAAALVSAVERVAENGAPGLVLVSGHAGVGKSALVHELYRPIAHRYGFFIAGKFEQYRRDVPYSTVVQAFGELARQLLATSEERLEGFRQRLRDELGASAQIVVDVIPETEVVLGRHPPAAPLPIGESQNRFNRVFRQFVGVFARAEHPLAIFLDDLQWADTASLRLLQHLITHPDLRHLLVVCAYRDNEIDASHPWTAARAAIDAAGVAVTEVALGPLSAGQIEALVTDTFVCERARAADLAALVYEKTAGNPFFAGQLLATLHAEELVRFDAAGGRWQWDLASIRARGYGDDVIDLMVGKLRGLPEACQRSLELASCLGAEFSPTTLAEVEGRAEAEALADLAPAIEAGLLARGGRGLLFVHDRVQQAAHALMSEAERAATQLRIGRHLRARLEEGGPGEHLFEAVDHLNAAAGLLTDPKERLDLARLNLRAGGLAKRSTAHASARIYLEAGMALLPADAWERHYDLQFALHRERSESECASGHNAAAEALFGEAMRRAATPLDRAQIQVIRVGLYYATGRLRESLDVGAEALRSLGIDVPADPEARRALIGPEITRIAGRFVGLDVEALEHAPAVEDPVQRVASDLLVTLLPPSYYLDIDLFVVVILRLVDISLTHGETDASVIGYASYALLLVTVLGDYDLAGRLARMTIRRADAIDDAFLKTKIYTIYGWFTGVWHEPFRRIPPYLRAGYQSGLECGDLIYAAFALLGQDTSLLSRADDLAQVEAQWAAHARLFAEMQHSVAEQTAAVVLDALPRLRGSGLRSPDDPDALLRTKLAGQMNSAVGTYYVLRCQRAYILGDFAEALSMGEAFESAKVAGLLGTYYCTEGMFYRALAAAARYDDVSAEQRPALLEVLRTNAAALAGFAARCPEGFADRSEVLTAEVARLEGRTLAALQSYDRAARIASGDGFTANEAIAHELGARLSESCGLTAAAHAHRRRAHAAYRRWGAMVKVRALETRHPELAASAPAPAAPSATQAPAPSLDLASALKASQALSGEIVQDRLLTSLMHVVIEHAGAERGLLLVDQGALMVAASARVDAGGTDVKVAASAREGASGGFASSVVHYVRRTRERVIVDDPAEGGTFALDPYVARERPRSVLCAPLMRGARLVGILYLENNWLPGAFTPERSALVSIIATQAAISIENAALYADLARENSERRLAEQTLRDKLAIIEAQRDSIRALSTPIIEVWDGVVTMPVFGAVDDDRAAQMKERLLDAVERTRADVALIDLTGVSVADTSTANHVIRLVRSVQLLGARGIVVGIRPDLARSFIALGVDLSHVETISDLRVALQLCLQSKVRSSGRARRRVNRRAAR